METYLWVEKYRPNTIDKCILPENLKKTFSEFVKDKHIPNLILSGGPGVGKTTVAKAMLEEIGVSFHNDEYKTPKYNLKTMESNSKGVYLAGVVCGGYKTNKWFIENSREHASIIINAISNNV